MTTIKNNIQHTYYVLYYNMCMYIIRRCVSRRRSGERAMNFRRGGTTRIIKVGKGPRRGGGFFGGGVNRRQPRQRGAA